MQRSSKGQNDSLKYVMHSGNIRLSQLVSGYFCTSITPKKQLFARRTTLIYNYLSSSMLWRGTSKEDWGARFAKGYNMPRSILRTFVFLLAILRVTSAMNGQEVGFVHKNIYHRNHPCGDWPTNLVLYLPVLTNFLLLFYFHVWTFKRTLPHSRN